MASKNDKTLYKYLYNVFLAFCEDIKLSARRYPMRIP
jgi:hypothetical protein